MDYFSVSKKNNRIYLLTQTTDYPKGRSSHCSTTTYGRCRFVSFIDSR